MLIKDIITQLNGLSIINLLVIKDLIYQDSEVDFTKLIDAIDDDFSNGHDALLKRIEKVPKFGFGNEKND